MKKHSCQWILLILILLASFFQTNPAKAQWFVDLENKTGTEAAKIVKQYGWKFVFTPVEAKTPKDFDRVSNIRIDGQNATIHATCASYYRVKDYANQRVKERATTYDVMEEFDGSPIKIEFDYQITTNPRMNGIIVRQSIRPGATIQSGVYEANAPPKQTTFTSFKKPKLIQNNQSSYSTYAPPQNKEIVIRFHAYKMAPVAMPDLTNMTYEDAISRLGREHVPVIYTQRDEKETKFFEKHNLVFEQSTKPGTVVSKNIMLGLRVYKFKGTTQVPDVLNKPQAEAVALIKKAALTPKVKYISVNTKYPVKDRAFYSARDLLGKAVEQTPNKGISVASATQVEITVLKEDETLMPDIIGLTEAQAEKQIINYRREFIYIYVKTGRDNIISATEPRSGQTLKTFDTIKVTIERTVPIIPYVIGMTEAQATDKLKKCGLTVSHIKKIPVVQLKTGQVFTIWPPVGTAITPGTIVTLTLADNEGMIFPSFFLKTAEDAIKILKESGYNNYVIDYKEIDQSDKRYYEAYKEGIGKVESTIPGPHQVVPQDTQIHLIVLRWAKEKPVEVPLLSGMSEQGAIARLKDKGLIPNITYSTTNLAAYNGKVLGGQVPKAYTSVKKGSIISFTVVAYKINMPTVMHLKEDEAITFLASLGLKTSITYEQTEISSRIGSIKAQKPAFREKIDSGGTVELLVYESSGRVTVPNLINHELNDTIIKVLTDKKLNYTVLEQETVLNTLVNKKIFKTFPAYPQSVAQGSTLTIYRYKKLEKVPDVVGKKEAAATKILENLGFAVQKYYINNAPAGIVSLQTQTAGSPPLHAAISISIGKTKAPAPMMSMKISQPSTDDTNKIREFYSRFKEAYESKDEYQVVSLISNDWDSNDGNSLSDLEDNLHNTFAIFDEIQYNISDLDIKIDQTKTYRMSYAVTIMGTIYESNITHTEKSSVQELVKIENGTVKIIKTLNGNFWSIE